jgi:hypothetical protein
MNKRVGMVVAAMLGLLCGWTLIAIWPEDRLLAQESTPVRLSLGDIAKTQAAAQQDAPAGITTAEVIPNGSIRDVRTPSARPTSAASPRVGAGAAGDQNLAQTLLLGAVGVAVGVVVLLVLLLRR